MSISDSIVLMRAGTLQQVGAPQGVYDDPANLFVAKFLGTPAINVFEGRVAAGRLLLGDDAVLAVEGVPDGAVWAGVRPEGFVLDPAGPLGLALERVEVMGRDVSVVSAHPASASGPVRSIIDAASEVDRAARTVRFALKPAKVLLFDRATEQRERPCDET